MMHVIKNAICRPQSTVTLLAEPIADRACTRVKACSYLPRKTRKSVERQRWVHKRVVADIARSLRVAGVRPKHRDITCDVLRAILTQASTAPCLASCLQNGERLCR